MQKHFHHYYLTERTLRTGTTLLDSKFDFDHWVAPSILGRSPTAARLPSWTSGTLVLPIHMKLFSGKARLDGGDETDEASRDSERGRELGRLPCHGDSSVAPRGQKKNRYFAIGV